MCRVKPLHVRLMTMDNERIEKNIPLAEKRQVIVDYEAIAELRKILDILLEKDKNEKV